jgi:uncharacterized protein (TIGR00369 family)
MSTPGPDPRLALLYQFMEEVIPFNRHLGLKVDAVEPGRCLVRLPWRPEFTGDPFRPAVHGGVTSMLVDTAGGLACFTQLPNPADRVSTVDLRVDYLRRGHGADLLCEARVVRMGNRVAVARMEVFSGALDGNPIATGQAVYNVVRSGET